jgi:hypothetical protein
MAVCGRWVCGKIDHEVLSWGKENLKGHIVILLGWNHIVSLFGLKSKPRYGMAWDDSRERARRWRDTYMVFTTETNENLELLLWV